MEVISGWQPWLTMGRCTKSGRMTRPDSRQANDHRPIEIIPGFQRKAEGSVLFRAGGTVVLCTASIDPVVPGWMMGQGKGWLTAEYQMHPRANARRESRDGRGKALSGRSMEIQRLIGRALRAAIDLDALGERTVAIDCDVLEADAGTRTASVSAGFVALALALSKLTNKGDLRKPVLRDQIAAISVGHVRSEVLLDLCYEEDRVAGVDMNVVASATGEIVEVQATAEGRAVPRREIDTMIDVALAGIASVAQTQRRALESAKVDLASLFQPKA